VPNIRNSAKNRKKLEQIFSIGANDNNSNINNKQTEDNKGNSLFTSNKKTVTSSNNNQENNLYLSKLKAEKNNNDNMGLNTSRYSPSNPESGIFSLSDYDNR
jgi:glycosidase